MYTFDGRVKNPVQELENTVCGTKSFCTENIMSGRCRNCKLYKQACDKERLYAPKKPRV